MNEEANTGLDSWVNREFDRVSEIRTPGEFDARIKDRMARLSELPERWQELRAAVRKNVLGIKEEAIGIFLGEQAAGLNEPVLVLGKRLLAHAMRVQHGHTVVEYLADSDVVGSEPGLHSMTLPNPTVKGGKEHTPLVPVARYNQTPTNLTPASELNLENLVQAMSKIYSLSNARVNELAGAYYSRLSQTANLAALQNAVFRYFEQQLGLNPRKVVHDVDFDSAVAMNGGLALVMEKWSDIQASARQHTMKGVRIPEEGEAPFYAYLKDLQTRANIYIANDEGTQFRAMDPNNSSKQLGTFSADDILEGKVGITFRAIPRAILLATIFDAHVSGGGSKYNKPVSHVYEEVFGIPFYPIAHMDIGSSNSNESTAVFQYDSAANRKQNATYLQDSKALVQSGFVSTVDMFASLTDVDLARKIIANTMTDPGFTMATRVDLSPASKYGN